ncbi:transposase [Trujillonella humicola]|uniref:transposase n=1 Tax=Trujillonella humicola TaxID=3383699 RepID=UPI003906D1E7
MSVAVTSNDPGCRTPTAIDDRLQDATAVLDAFHVVKVGTDAVDRCRRRIQQEIHSHRRREHDPPYRIRKTGSSYLRWV